MSPPATTAPSRARLLLGGSVFIAGFAAPLLIPVVTGSNLPAGWKTFLSGFLAIGIPEIFMLFAAGILGKEGFAYLKSKLWRLIAPPETVGLVRYRIGLLMFVVPIGFIWLHPYLEQAQPELAQARMHLGLASVGLMTVSLFVLGGEFWDKLRGLFKGLLASRVSRGRHRLGVLLLAVPVLIGFSWPYLTGVFEILHQYKYKIAIAGDVMLVAAVFVLGGGFWDKLVGLFRHRSRAATMPATRNGGD